MALNRFAEVYIRQPRVVFFVGLHQTNRGPFFRLRLIAVRIFVY